LRDFSLFWPKFGWHALEICNQKRLLHIDRPRRLPVIINHISAVSRRNVFIAIIVPLSIVYDSVSDEFTDSTNPISKPNSAWICHIHWSYGFLWYFCLFWPTKTWTCDAAWRTYQRLDESWHVCRLQLLVRHSELEQSETKAQAALVTILSLTQITELKLLLDIGRQGHRFYDFVLTLLVACISLEICVGVIIIYIGNLHYYQV